MPCFSVFHRTRRKEKFKLSEAEHEPPLLVLGAEPQELSLGGFLANLHGAGEKCPRNLGYDDDINRSSEWRGGYLIPGALHTEETGKPAQANAHEQMDCRKVQGELHPVCQIAKLRYVDSLSY